MKLDARRRDFFDRHVVDLIIEKYGMDEMTALRSFINSESYSMLLDQETGVYRFSPLIIFDMWEAEQITGNPRNSLYIRGEW